MALTIFLPSSLFSLFIKFGNYDIYLIKYTETISNFLSLFSHRKFFILIVFKSILKQEQPRQFLLDFSDF